jgi:hypothetical protein
MGAILQTLARNRASENDCRRLLEGQIDFGSPDALLSKQKPGWRLMQSLQSFQWARPFVQPGHVLGERLAARVPLRLLVRFVYLYFMVRSSDSKPSRNPAFNCSVHVAGDPPRLRSRGGYSGSERGRTCHRSQNPLAVRFRAHESRAWPRWRMNGTKMTLRNITTMHSSSLFTEHIYYLGAYHAV